MHDINYKSAWQLKREAKQARLKSTQEVTPDLDEQEVEEMEDRNQQPERESTNTSGVSRIFCT